MIQTVKPGYKQTEVGVIPEKWKIGSLGVICDVRDGTHESPRFFKDGVPFVTSKNIVDGHLDLENVSYISKSNAVEFDKRSKVDRNDILLSMIGTIGSAVLVECEPSFCIKNVALLKPRKVSPRFLIHLINSPIFQKYLADNLDGGIQKFISLGTLRQLSIQLPDEPEQRAIATALSDVDALLAALDRLFAKQRDIKQAAMQQLLTGQTRLPGFEGCSTFKQTEVGLIPEDWRVESVGVISTVGRGRVISHREIALAAAPLYPVYSSQTSDNGIMGYLDTFQFDGEYITWTTDGANAGTVFHRNGRFNCTNVCGTIKLKTDNAGFVSRVLAGITPPHVSRNLGNPKLMNDVMKRISIPLPPLPEQTAIATVLADMDLELAAMEQRRDKTRALKQGMMQELLTGRTRLVASPQKGGGA
jgi:type I restriction enzyme S subunit